MNDSEIRASLQAQRVIAVIGFSLKPDRPSHYVTRYMHNAGYTMLPVNPLFAGQPSGIGPTPVFASVREAIEATGLTPGIVNVFRRSEDVGPAVSEAIDAGASMVWMQQGIENDEEARRAQQAGLSVVMDRCIKVEHARLLGSA